MNTKMITTNRAEELVKQQTVEDSDDDEDYINVTSLFKRNVPANSVEDIQEESSKQVEIDEEEMKRRYKALSGVDKISSSLSTGKE